MNNYVEPNGMVACHIEYKNGRKKTIRFKNAILRKGRQAIAKSLANEVGDTYDFYIARMVFGDGGTNGGSLKFVSTERNGLFGTTRANKSVVSSVDSTTPTQAVFTSVLAYSEANGYTLNEMALVMNTGDFYSMATFPDLTKTEEMQIVFNWTISIV